MKLKILTRVTLILNFGVSIGFTYVLYLLLSGVTVVWDSHNLVEFWISVFILFLTVFTLIMNIKKG
jgi:hypothetical protein